MEKEKIDFFRNLLNERFKNLIKEASKTMSNMMNKEEAFPDLIDLASLECNRNSLLNIRERERNLIQNIREALDSIDNGTYGYCEECGEEEKRNMCHIQFELMNHIANTLLELQRKQNVLTQLLLKRDETGSKLLKEFMKKKSVQCYPNLKDL